MIERLDKKISLKQLTAEKDFNLSLFHKVFTQIYGDTPYAYMKKYKMNIAANELKNTDRKIRRGDHADSGEDSRRTHDQYFL